MCVWADEFFFNLSAQLWTKCTFKHIFNLGFHQKNVEKREEDNQNMFSTRKITSDSQFDSKGGFFLGLYINYYGTRKRNRKKMLTMTRSKKIWIKLKKKSLHALLLTHLIPLSPPQSNWTIHYYYIKIVTQSHFNTCIRGRVLRTLLYRGIQSICKTTPSNR